jgi:hypothetical protein
MVVASFAVGTVSLIGDWADALTGVSPDRRPASSEQLSK